MKNKSVMTLGITILLSIGLTACSNSREIVNNDAAEAMVAEVTSTTESVDIEDSSIEEATEIEGSTVEESSIEEMTKEYSVEAMDKKMQATENADTYAMPDGDEVKSVVQQDEIVSIIGKVDGYNWYKIIQEGEIESYIDGVYLEEIKETPSQGQQVEVQQPQPEVQQPTQEQPAVQPSVEQPPQETSPQEQPAQPSNGRGINQATGEPWKIGDRNEAGDMYMGDMTDFMSDPNNW